MSRRVVLLFLFAAAPRLLGAYAARDLYLPIVGQASGADGRGYFTTLWITNVSTDGADVTLSFLKPGAGNPSPRATAFSLGPHQTRVIDDVDALFSETAFGALHIQSTADVIANARLHSRMPGEPLSRGVASSFGAIPAQFAVANGESAILQGVVLGEPPELRYKLYLVETTGQPLAYALALVDTKGRTIAQKHSFLSGREPRISDLRDEFPGTRVENAVLRVSGINGSGRIIAAGAQIAAASQDGTAYEMSFNTRPRSRLGVGETVAYVAAALAIAAAAVASWRRK